MNEAHWHLLTNHLPIVFPVVGIFVMGLSWIFPSESTKRISYLIFMVGAITSWIAMMTGDRAEDFVENFQGIDHHMIHDHEEIAETFSVICYLLGATSIFAFWLSVKNRPWSKWFGYLTMGIAITALYFAKETGTSGGEIRHSEIRTSAGESPTLPNTKDVEKD